MSSQPITRPRSALHRLLKLVSTGAILLAVTGCALLFDSEPDAQFVTVYEEEFTDPASYTGTHGWNTSDTADAASWVANGAMQLLIRSADYYSAVKPTGIVTDEAFRLDAGACLLAGPPKAEVGVVFCVQDNWDHLRFTLSRDGMMRFRRRADSSWTTLVDWTPCPAANPEIDCNAITVIADGSHFDFYVNEVWVLEGVDATFDGGGIGVVAGTPLGEPGTHGAFPIVILSEPL